jgi:potassium efflux system protein
MTKLNKIIPVIALVIALFSSMNGFAQSKNKKELYAKREAAKRAMHTRDSLLRSFNKSDTSVNSLLQRIEQYTATFNQIRNSLADGLDTVDISEALPPVVKRIEKIGTLTSTHKSSTLRYLFVLRDNLDRTQGKLEGWQTDLQDVATKLVQNETDLVKFSKDTLLKTNPADSTVRKTFFLQRREVGRLWYKIDSVNRRGLLKVNLLQDKIAIAYTQTLDEADQIDSKIKNFALKAFAGEAGYVWAPDPQYNDFEINIKSTVKLDQLLFNYFIKNEPVTHLISLLFFVLIFGWVIYNRTKLLKTSENGEALLTEANYICKRPILSPLLVATAIIPYFYSHPPTVFLELFFLISIILSIVLIKDHIPKAEYQFLIRLFVLAVFYSISNLFIEISNIDRYFILLLSMVAILMAAGFYKKVKKSPDDHLKYTGLALTIFIALQVLSMLLNISGRFSLSKIVGVTAVFNLWQVVIFFLIIKIIIQSLYLQFEAKKDGKSIINWIDYDLVQKKFTQTLILITSILWLVFLLQNLNIDDWTRDYAEDILGQSQAIGSASFTIGGFVIFIFVIWLSSIVSKIISYFYDVSAQRVTDLSMLKKKNRTSVLIIRMTVFSLGFLLAVALSNFPLDKLTIIISAFGVGIGFGLQNIVNNLVSGLILAFEKPINIGDVIQVDGHTGTMKEIGIRSSKIATGDGSEVIIPNGDLISHQVINWTLSNSNRQIVLSIITAYGVGIDKVKDLLKDLLANRDDIMDKPAPSVLISNMSESAIEFQVSFWEADISTTGSLKSKILTEIYDLIGKEGIQLPSTQKDIYVHFPEGVPFANPDKKEPEEKSKKKETKDIKENPAGQDQ